MSGEESLAQVYREIEHPKLKNLKRADGHLPLQAAVHVAGLFLRVAIIPDAERPKYLTT